MLSKTMTIEGVKNAKSIKERVLGLILKGEQNGLLLKTRFGIHTFGMGRGLDVLVLNDDNKAVKLKENLKPNGIFIWNPRFSRVLELERGTIRKYKIKLGVRVLTSN